MKGLYKQGREGIARGRAGVANQTSVSWSQDTIIGLLIAKDAYTPDLENHLTLNSVPASAVVAESIPLEWKSITGGWLKADPVLFPNVTGAQQVGAVVYYRRASTTRADQYNYLIAYTDEAIGLPFLPPNPASDVLVEATNGIARI